MSTKQDPVMVMSLEFPATKGVLGDTESICGDSQSCAWQNVAEISNKSVAA
jgi:hypothetical protein